MAVPGATSSVALAAAPGAPAGVKASVMPATGALSIAPSATVPSGSVALSTPCAGTPKNAPTLGGQLAATGWLTGAPHTLSVDALLRGVGAPLAKSAALLSVSVQPPAARSAAVVFDRLGVVGEPSNDDAAPPKPIRSSTPGAVAQPVPQVSAVVLLTSATLPLVADMAMPLPLPMASGVGSGVVPPVPA